jgi:peptide-methionine (R)-S-oxide reductase
MGVLCVRICCAEALAEPGRFRLVFFDVRILAVSVLTDAADRGFNNLDRDPMRGGRITSEERSAISTYVGAGVAVLLAVVGIYFFFLTQKEKKETTTFDPNRPVPSDTVLKSRLKAEEYAVVRGNGSQTPFQNEFWNNEKTGIYVDVIAGEPLFASIDKFDGHVGLPTFTKPISKDVLIEVPDNSNEMQRTQVRAKRSNARLGHVFPDPKSPTGQRYVVYSAAFHFVPVDQMKDRGYEVYLPLFDKK